MTFDYIVCPDGYGDLNGPVTEDDLLPYFDDYLDMDGEVSVAGLSYYPSTILREVDPIAYRVGFLDWVEWLREDGYLDDYEDDHEWLRE